MTEVVNYTDIRESLDLILREEAPEEREAIIESLDDQMANHHSDLVIEE